MDNYTPDPFSQNNKTRNGQNDDSGGYNENSGSYGYNPDNGAYNNYSNGYNPNNGAYNNYSNDSNPNNGAYNNYSNGSNPNNGYGYNGNPYNNGFNGGPYAQNCPSFSLWLTLSILCAVFASRICGVIGLIYLIMANNSFKSGNYPQYESQMKTVKIALLVGIILHAVLFMIGVIGRIIFSYGFKTI